VQHAAQKIAERLDHSWLPCADPATVPVGYGRWHRCDGCDEVIVAAQVEYRLQYAEDRSYRLHAGCYGLWDEMRREASGSPRGRAAERRRSRGARRVVIIEDSEDTAEVLRMQLAFDGHHVHVAHDGERGIELVEKHQADVALVDIGLRTGMDGYEVARRLRARGEKLFLVALTGYGRDEERARAFEAGFDAHFLKPCKPDEVVRAVALSPRRPEHREDRSAA
jgi:CheY-like chemotaxis protein